MRDKNKKNKISVLQRTRNNFLTGLVFVTPILVTAYLVWGVITYIDTRIVPLIPDNYNPSKYVGKDIPGLGVVMFLVFTTLIGALAKGFIGKQIVLLTEGVLYRTPVIRVIYKSLKQLIETVFNSTNNSFQKACLIQYPRPGLWAIAFVATSTTGEVHAKINTGNLVSVFVPTTPNPTSGFILFVPEDEVIILDMTIEDAAKMVISAGLVVPEYTNKKS